MTTKTKHPILQRVPIKVALLVEGNIDIRMLLGLHEVCELETIVPQERFEATGLKKRVADCKVPLVIHEIPGKRLSFQLGSFKYLLKHSKKYDVILAQEMLRGAFNANIVGKLTSVPVVNFVGIPAIEYFSCRYRRRQISWFKDKLGKAAIHFFLRMNGLLSAQSLGAGPYLRDIVAQTCSRTGMNLFFGVDTNFFCPATKKQKTELRKKRKLPEDRFIIFLSSRMTHEKDPETALLASARFREMGYNPLLINLSGDFEKFLALAKELKIPDAEEWVIGAPPAHPMIDVADYFRLADAVMLCSLEEGAAMSTLEGLSCATPVVASKVGGMEVQLEGLARLAPRRDAEAMANELKWIAENPAEAKTQAQKGREYILENWSRELAFKLFQDSFVEVTKHSSSTLGKRVPKKAA